jgi:hypothetical protein
MNLPRLSFESHVFERVYAAKVLGNRFHAQSSRTHRSHTSLCVELPFASILKVPADPDKPLSAWGNRANRISSGVRASKYVEHTEGA